MGIYISLFNDNGGEFVSSDFPIFCENFNVTICTMAAESRWSNGLIERHNVSGLTVTKTIKDTHCDLETAVAWGINSKK